MESQNEPTPPEEPRPAEPVPAPKKRFQLKRLQIEELEERITPRASGGGHVNSGGFY
jgi:hypothetical protein